MRQYLSSANGIMEAMKKGRGILFTSRKTGRTLQLIKIAGKHGIPVRNLSAGELSRIRPEHRGYLLQIDTIPGKTSGSKSPSLEKFVQQSSINSLVLILDGISDPVNFGNILRAADQFQADAVIIPRHHSVRKNADSLSRSSAGAVEWVRVIEVPNCSRAVEILKKNNFWVWGADASEKSELRPRRADKVDMNGRIALVMGREGAGLHRLVKEKCDGLITIPTSGRINSLNVSAAAAILLYEAHRQNGFNRLQG